MRINFTITYADGTAAEATASVADQVAFEQAHDRSIARLADDFDTWLDKVENVEFGQGKIVPLEGTTTPTG